MEKQKEIIENKLSDDMGKMGEEFNNFMHKVTEVDGIIKKLTSKDKDLQAIGDQEAKLYLREETVLDDIDGETISLKVTNDRTIVNKIAQESGNPNEMSKDSFMAEVERDADQRYKDRLIRTEKMETFKKQATLAFRRKEFEKALVLYNKAIEQIKDSPLLYNNRALTYIKLGFPDKAKSDLENWALKLNEDCLKSWLLLAKINYLSGDEEESKKCVLEAKKRNPKEIDFIEDYMKTMYKESRKS
ncbi:unnamed protein product [Ceutorhynchus assimilis]|uniref:Tetratricopeptide repeat protein 12 n=1 Tax=Ceutorhynchus assimilis TaxID=467358 RepID=A0A9N9QIS5_9CUCU|nr:unnamed protein product [Ceutorhynchus assimilis]